MLQPLREIQADAGATFDEEGDFPLSFDNDAEAIAAAHQGVAVADRSHWGLIQLNGNDRLRFLHNQSTNEIQNRQSGESCGTVFVNSTARTLDLATVYILAEMVWVLVSPNRRQSLLEWLDGYIFPMDQVKLKDLTTNYAVFSIVGPKSDELMGRLGAGDLKDQPMGHHQVRELEGVAVRIARGNGLSDHGYTLLVPAPEAKRFWRLLMDLDVVPLGDRIWQHLRILHGRPAPDAELTEDYNPLEAGLWQMISFEKGCYIGQETIARLNTYKGVKQYLWGLRLNGSAAPGTAITLEGQKVGLLTSYTDLEQPPFGLGYIRVKAGSEGLKVQVGDTTAEVVDVPFLTHVSMAK
ncbi:MAG: folate-binding protein [Microcoleaceae cyanobacterium]